ncbi:excinuclease ABC subunit UvrA [Halosquirtibacter laminarini]|uniref:Excinuclease ABC subunit UvrA n=1 Tax=Halosquirtibacter laminarini TaxID=3374600 RepID=A0AC61NCR8_9BACT|nr:excinuclease ABC subunit UvrA [Prolixibacteraceae bacterium]
MKRYTHSEEDSFITVTGAKEHNLKNIDIQIPRDQLTVITGLSGSGKSSLAFDTIYAEGQRRYIETFSSYARSFLGNMERPDVDEISGLSPVISIEQKTTNKNPRSTVGTVTEIYDFLRLLFARASSAYSYNTGEEMVKFTPQQILDLVLKDYSEKPCLILSPVVKNRKGHYRELFEQILRKGFLHARVDGEVISIEHGMKLDRYKNHTIEIVIDRLIVSEKDLDRLKSSIEIAMRHGEGIMMISNKDGSEYRYFSRNLMCPTSGIAYAEPAPHNFSFNSPQGACSHCNGMGEVTRIDIDLIIPDKEVSIQKGGILPLGPPTKSVMFRQIEGLLKKYQCNLKTPLKEVPEECIHKILNGTSEKIPIGNESDSSFYNIGNFEGIVKYITMQSEDSKSKKAQKWANQFQRRITCPMCEGQRLKKESRYFKVGGKNIAELSGMNISTLYHFLNEVEDKLNKNQKVIAKEILKELRTRIHFLLDVGLDYLSLNRSSRTLSGGESQRIRLATQIGSQLVNVLYILDEPSIGLHQRDNQKLIQSLNNLRDIGNTIIVVEHDKDMMLEADFVVDMGPRAGRYGGEVIASGTPEEVMKMDTITSKYLSGKVEIAIPKQRRKGNGEHLILKGATGNNLKEVTVSFPLGRLICITGVSGSGKSSLINGTLQPILSQYFYKSVKDPLPYHSIEGLDHIDKVVQINQSPLGRTPRSNPATYTGLFSDIRSLFAQLPESKVRGYKPGRFSFNVKGGRCEKCKGAGMRVIEMNFLPDVLVNCDECNGQRYNRETREIRYKGKSISDVLNMTINQAVEYFDAVPSMKKKLQTLKEVGLGYVTLGQSSTTLSGGESQRVKLASELSKKDTGKTLYILDEPTTGLHFEDIRILLEVINSLVDKGNTVIIIEHNMDVIKTADHIIDIGKEGGIGGGEILCVGTPEEVAKNKESYTAKYLKQEL